MKTILFFLAVILIALGSVSSAKAEGCCCLDGWYSEDGSCE
jgi:hypothetical protein